MQGRTTFGGLIAALAVQAMRDVEGSDWPLRALQASFIGPVGGPTSAEVTLLRQGRNVRQVQATLRSSGQVAAVILAAFGQGRPTAVPERRPEQPPVDAQAADLVDFPFIPGFSPSFLQHFASRWAGGEPPFVGRASWHSFIYTRPRDPIVDFELTAILLADMPPTPVLSVFDRFVPASSVSWELELIPQKDPVDFAGYHRVDTDVIAAADGYVSQRSTLWTPGGALAALGYQVVGVYG
jgi:acyl-CoA thioesterase